MLPSSKTVFLHEMKKKIKIDIVSDVVCPWCYIGKRRIENAVEKLKDEFDFEFNYIPFELHPDITNTTTLLNDYLASKFGSAEQVEEMRNRVSAVALEEGIQFNFSAESIVPNTLDCHKLIHAVKDFELKTKLMEALFKAYFTNNINVGLHANIEKIGLEHGLTSDFITEALKAEASEIKKEIEFYRQSGINSVPSYIVNDQYLIQGAQSTESFIESLQKIGNIPTPSSESCSPNSGCC